MSPTSTRHHDGPTVAQVHRALAIDPRITAYRADREASLRRVMRALLVRADRDTLISRPPRPLIAQMADVCERTVTSRINDAIALGYVTILEPGTTRRIRAGRCYPAPDPYASEGNRAQVYQLHIPAELAAEILGDDSREDASRPRVPAGHRRTCAPSPRTESTRGKNTSTHVVTTATTTRARGSNRHHPAKVKTEKQNSSQKNHHQRRAAGRGLWRTRLADVQAVWQQLPTALTDQLADHEAPRIADAIALQLTHRSPAELAERITRHWAYWRYKLAAGLVRSPAAIAFRLIRRDFDCPDVRCEDRHQLDLDAPCKACALKSQEIWRARHPQEHPRCNIKPAPRPARPLPPPVPPRPTEVAEPNTEYRDARAALMRSLGSAAVRARPGRQAIA